MKNPTCPDCGSELEQDLSGQWCLECSEGSVEMHEANVDLIGNALERRNCGVNADWSVDAWQLTEGEANMVDLAHFILLNDDGDLELVLRDLSNDECEIETINTAKCTPAGVKELVKAWNNQ